MNKLLGLGAVIGCVLLLLIGMLCFVAGVSYIGKSAPHAIMTLIASVLLIKLSFMLLSRLSKS